MTPTSTLLDDMVAKLAASTATFADAAFLEIILAKNPFTESKDRVLADLTPADFDGYAAIDTTAAGGIAGSNPATGGKTIEVKVPAGGFHWLTSGVTNLPQTIYGYGVKAKTSGLLIGCHRFATPIVLTASGQDIDLDSTPRVEFVASPAF